MDRYSLRLVEVVAALVAALLGSPPRVPAPRTLRLAQLPAVSDDGRFVAVAMRLADGARANDNLTLGIIDVVADRLVDSPTPLASLAAVDLDPTTGVLLLEIGYDGGTDICWEPDQTFHVVRLRQ